MELKDALKQCSLNDSEIKVYIYLLEVGMATPAQVAKGTGIARANCYHVLRSLWEQDLVAERKDRKKKVYYAKDPQALVSGLEERKARIEEILPDLRGLYAGQINKPKIRFFEGLEQVKQIYLETLSAEKIRAMGSVKQLSDKDPKFYSHYIKELKKKNIILDDILTEASREQGAPEISGALNALYTTKFLPAKYSDFPTDILLWEDNIAIITLEEPIFGTILTNSTLAKTFRVIFEVMWKSLG